MEGRHGGSAVEVEGMGGGKGGAHSMHIKLLNKS